MNRKVTEDYVFIRPAEAPIFYPTADEFKNPLAYLSKIRPIAEKAGICKIRPPPGWQPPFAVDVDKFRFTPRIQRLNELEAKTRVKLNFLDNVAKYYELSGNSLKIPVIEKKALDLYSLYKFVEAEGGRAKVNNDKKWNRIALRMGYPTTKNYGPLLKIHYEKILLRIEKFEHGKKKGDGVTASPKKFTQPATNGNIGRMGGSGMASGSGPSTGRMAGSNASNIKVEPDSLQDPFEIDKDQMEAKLAPKELRQLLFYGAGPKTAGFNKQLQDQAKERLGADISDSLTSLASDPLAKYMCNVCDGGEAEAEMLICEGCDDSYHIFCLDPPLTSVPPGDWKCTKCVAEDLEKPGEAFGFEQAQREYTLQQFGEMADHFKSEYFNMPAHAVPMELVEKEFWRIVSAIDEDVMVEYGADLHTMDHGSGFPTKDSTNLLAPDEKYITSGWNLNNIPLHQSSVFRHIHADISGMKVPWMYVGMCFSTFCWHNEDHWSYSINYLHWGEPKTWYGVPGAKADDFENAMKQAAPELFASQPDLLHQLVTIMNPNILMKAGVPVYRMDQTAGEFIITFPRAYHAGFNQGYNFAEAVNFAPADWLPMGRECVRHYSNLHRYCVFSHDELVCKMASEPADLDMTIAVSCYKDMLTMFEEEQKLRGNVLSLGVNSSERVPFELLPDDERICDFCKATCFLSALSCSCSKGKLVCIKHYKELCGCPPDSHVLKYRYTLEELPSMLKKIKSRIESYEIWHKRMQSALNPKSEMDKIDFKDMHELMNEMEVEGYPKSQLVEKALECYEEAQKCILVARKMAMPEARDLVDYEKVTVEELEQFLGELYSLKVKVQESEIVEDLLEKVKDFENVAKDTFQTIKDKSWKQIEEIIASGLSLNVDLPILDMLIKELERDKFLKRVNDNLCNMDYIWTPKELNSEISKGETLFPDLNVKLMVQSLKDVLGEMEAWEMDVLRKLDGPICLKELEVIIQECEGGAKRVKIDLLDQIKDMVKKAYDWESSIRGFKSFHPFYEELARVVERGMNLKVHFHQMVILKGQLDFCKSWKERCAKTLFTRPITSSLIELLLPRKIEHIPQRERKKKFRVDHSPYVQASNLLCITPRDTKESIVFDGAYEQASKAELESMMQLRKINEAKWEDNGAKFCVCQGPLRQVMLTCDLCLEKYHTTCIPLARTLAEANPGSLANLAHEIIEKKGKWWLCRVCSRSKRPGLLKLLSLLKEMAEIPVRILEYSGIKALTNRGVLLHEKIVKLLGLPEVIGILQELHSQEGSSDVKGEPGMEEGESEDKSRCLRNINLNENPVQPQHTLSEELMTIMEAVLIEGLLIEVTISELETLWKLFEVCKPKGPKISISLEAIKECIDAEMSEKSSPIKNESKFIDASEENSAKRKIEELMRKGPKKIKKEDPSADVCSHSECKIPSGDNWVQCETCELWFHHGCAGISEEKLDQIAAFACVDCFIPVSVEQVIKSEDKTEIVDLVD